MKNITIENFINAAILDGEFSKLGDSKQVNKNYKNLESIKSYLLKNEETFITDCKKLLSHENDSVKLHAAVTLLPYSSKEAISTLKQLSTIQGLLGFTAKMTLSEYKKGNICSNN